jgi:F0F1-type ATP synthase assembly protein I
MAGKDQDSGLGKNLALGLEVAVGAGLGAWLGGKFDHRYHTDPWGILVGVLLGCAAGMYLLIKEAIRYDKK